MSEWSIQLFGGLRVSGPETEITRFPTKRSALLLARLSLSRTGNVSRDELAETLWPDDFLDSTRTRLRQELNRLRDSLGPAALMVKSDRSWIGLDFEAVTIDAREFDRLLSTQREDALAAAINLYEGPLLPEQNEDWVLAQRQEYQARCISALIKHGENLLSTDKAQESLTFALRAVRSDPYHEPSRSLTIRALVKVGEVAGALRQYSEFEKLIAKEFGSRPSPAMQTLHASLRHEKPKESESRAESPAPQQVRTEPSAPMPIYLESIVGRADELRLIQDWLKEQTRLRLITITGPGGVGKTRLAITAAAASESFFDGNVFFFGLADIEAGHGVISKIQKAFNPNGLMFSDEPLPDWGAKPCLIILDNAEHVLDEARGVAQQILLSHPGACLIVTSRQRLGIGGEQELPVPPLKGLNVAGGRPSLDESPAAQLFMQRARAVRPGYNLPEDQIENLALLIERLDGLPLSIELAAARITAMTAAKMLQEIDDRFTFLVSRRSDVSPRHRSLRATIEWSFQGLREELRDLMEVLAMFRSGWTLELAQSASGRQDVYEALQDLMECSLIFSDEGEDGLRFGMLEAIREYVTSELAEDRAENLRMKHAEVIAAFMVEHSQLLRTAEQNRHFNQMFAEMDNATAAVEWSINHRVDLVGQLGSALWRVWSARGKPADGAKLMDRMLEAIPKSPPREWAVALLGRSVLAFLLGDDEVSTRCCKQAAEIFAKLKDQYGVTWAKYSLGRALLKQGRTKEALENLLFVVKDDKERRFYNANLKLAEAYARLDEPEKAMAYAEEGFAGAISHHDLANAAVAYGQLAEIYFVCGRYEGVHGLFLEGLERARKSFIQDFEMFILLGLAREELRQGNMEAFYDAGEKARVIAENIRDHCALIALQNMLAQAEPDPKRSFSHHEEALRLALTQDGGTPLLDTVRLLAAALAREDRAEEALKILAMESSLREHLGTGLNLLERQHLEETLGPLGPLPTVPAVETTRQLAAKSLAILKGIPVVAAV